MARILKLSHYPFSQSLQYLMQLRCNLFRIHSRIEVDRASDAHANFSWSCEFSSRLFQLKESVDAHGQYRYSETACEQTNALAKLADIPVHGVPAFGKNQDAVSAIDRFSGIRETFSEANLTRERKQIQ